MSNSFETPINQNDFKNQFDKVEEIKVAGGTAEVVDIRITNNLKTDVPLFLTPAWACTNETYKPVLETLANTDRRVLGINHPRFGGDMSTAPEDAVNKYPNEELRKALNILNVIEQKGIDQVDVITHSEGAINTAIAAMLHPEKFRNIVFFAPAGLIGEDTFSRLLKGFANQSKPAESLAGMKIDDETTNAAWEAIKYLSKNPVRGIKETIEVSKSQIHDVLRYLHEKGIGIIVMATVDDPVFPMNKIQSIVKKDMIDGFLSVRGGHALLNMHAETADKMLDALERKSEKK